MSNPVVVITGASSGIGAETAVQAAAAGARVVLVARRERELAAVADRCAGQPLVIAADVSLRDEVRRVAGTVLDHHPHLDVWINNVGRGITRLPSALTDEDIAEMMRVNVLSALYGMQEVLPHFRARGSGHVINVSSLLGRIPSATPRSAYAAAKHFLNALTAMMRDEVRATHPGIQFSLVSPGVVYTGFGRNALHGGPDSRALPAGQEPAEVAAVIVRLLTTRQPDIYTRPGSRALVADYYATLGEDP